ncbi:protein SULFUR DEFICIENCY-INDUCED 1 [Silene latifolia]|uniref:protein SULFUR DEFICIENCY-INDUCED 1 n=1 Tax=Silene latifolia TaxID=37657 RepID=UPI003D778A02
MRTDQNSEKNLPRNEFYTPPPISKQRNSFTSKTWMSEKKPLYPDVYHVIHKVPHGNSPYVKAKHVQMVEKDPGKAVSLFWNAINSGDRVDSALKDMAAVMKQLNRPDEAIEAIRSFRHLCPADSQESIDNVLVELYKRSGRLEEEIEVLLLKLKRVEEVNCFGGMTIRMGRSHGKRIPVRPQQEYARLLGNLAWAYLQLNEYRSAEEYYRKALSIEPDRNKQCNLAVCLMCMNNITEAKFLLQSIQSSAPEGKMDETYAKAYERAVELLSEIESHPFDNKENNSTNTSVFAFSPYKKDPFSWQSLGKTPPIPDRRQLKSPMTQPKRDARWTPPIPAGKFLVSPFTQPRTGSRLPDTDDWRKGPHRNEPISHFPRRLQFGDPAELRTSTKENISETDWVENGLNLAAYEGKKSWADIAEEEEEAERQQQQEKRRLDVFRELAPANPKA